MEKEKKRPKTFKTIAIRVSALVLAVWLVFMLCLTWAVAENFHNQLNEEAFHFTTQGVGIRRGTDLSELPGFDDLMRIERFGLPYQLFGIDRLLPFVCPQRPGTYGSDDWFFDEWELIYGFQPAAAFYDEDGDLLMTSGNYLTFAYTTQENWTAKMPELSGIGYVNLDKLSYGMEAFTGLVAFPTGDFPSDFWSWTLRLTGYFEGNEFIPTSIDRAYDHSAGYELSVMAQANQDGKGKLEWENIVTQDLPSDAELVTVYSWRFGGCKYEHQSLTVNGVKYNSLVDYVTAAKEDNLYAYQRNNLFDSILIWMGRGDPEDAYGTYVLAVRCWPMQYAALRLIPTYLVSFALVALALRLVLRSIKHNVTNSLETLVHSLTTDAPIWHLSSWQEPHALETILKGEQEQRRRLVNDNQQLKASLEYAKNAEENRRQLVSNITHELKTPLAIIHSYAEGLQSGIAGEKKEKYLSTILEETERMDAMVLEMLDHSRLESGKVKLAADHFSLLKLTRSVAEKLTPAMEARKLHLSWGFCNDCMLTADESRMGQVVTNLLSNAVRYTPEGGSIYLRVFSDAKEATFQIENESEHLPEAVLEKIFETFYRADDSRTGKGTGLGLPIAKSIVELHRGTIRAMNTRINGEKYVQFIVTIPLK